MPKLTLRALETLRPGAVLPDPAVPGLRYQRGRAGIYAQLRAKLDGTWKSFGLGPVDIDGACFDAALARAEAAGDYDEQGRAAISGFVATLEDALAPTRTLAREYRARLRQGIDPRAVEPVDTRPTLGATVDQYLRDVVKRPRTQAERERYLRVDWKPLHHRPLAAITSAEIRDHLRTLRTEAAKRKNAKGGIVAANRARAALAALFSWAIEEEKVSASPVPARSKTAVEPSRDRVLTLAELRQIWAATAGEGDHDRIVRLLALTAQRREEVGGMAWEELDLERALWSLPGARTKNGRAHQVPLSTQAVAILGALETRPGRDLLFGQGDASFSGWSRCKRRLDQRCGVTGWTLHDLRRSAVTHMAELGIEPHVVEACVNHVSGHKGGVAGIYNRATYAPQKAAAMQRWADHLLEAPAAKVIPLHAAATA